MAKAATQAKSKAAYACSECGWTSARWIGRCGECQAWGTVVEVGAPKAARITAGPVTSPAMPIAKVSAIEAESRPTGIGELDRVLGGGVVPGAVILLAGEPGVGKSTLLLEVAAQTEPAAVETEVSRRGSIGWLRRKIGQWRLR